MSHRFNIVNHRNNIWHTLNGNGDDVGGGGGGVYRGKSIILIKNCIQEICA